MRRLFSLLTASLLAGHAAFAAAEADLLIAYDQSYVAHAGGEANAQVLAANAIAGTNAVNEHSGTGARLRVVGYYQSAQNLSGASTLGGYVGWMHNRDARIVDVVNRGDALGADLVTFICQPTAGEGSAAVAQQPGRFSAYGPPHFWLAVVAHEFGHNYGRSHNDGRLSPKSIMLHNYCGGGAAPPYVFTNRNIWFNDIRFVGDGDNCAQGSLINSGDNSLPSATTAQAVADRFERVVAAPNLDHVIHRWNFAQPAGGAPAGTTVDDEMGGSFPATILGGGVTFTGSGVRLPGSSGRGGSGYIELPEGIVSSHAEITIEIWATPLAAEEWSRLLDFNNGTSDYLMLALSRGTNLGNQRFESRHNNTAVGLDSNITTLAGVQHHYAITYTSHGGGSGRWQWFRDGDAVAYLDVAYPLPAFQDVNNWLGRSTFTGDGFARCEYAEVRISNVALSRDEILAHYLLGPNYDQTATVTLTGSDPLGTSSFNQAGRWSDAAAPAADAHYETFGHTLRTPQTSSSATFNGASLSITGGRLLYKGTASSTVTIHDLLADDATLRHAGSGAATLAGNVEVGPRGALFLATDGPFHVAAGLSGDGPVTYRGGHPVTLAGGNSAFTGRILVGDGNAGTLAIDSPARLGAPPASPVADLLTFNRGTLRTTATMALDDPNRGIYFDINGGTFDVVAGTTLTISSPLSTRFTSGSITAGAINKRGAGTLVLDSSVSTFNGTLSIDSSSSTADDGIVRVTRSNALANARRIYIGNNNSGRSTLQLDGSGGDVVLPAGIEAACRNNDTPALHNLTGTNTVGGGIALNVGGNRFNIRSDDGLLVVNGTNQYVGSLTGGRTFAFSGDGDHRVSGPILRPSNGAPISVTKTGTGTLTLAGANTYDGPTNVQGGELKLNGSLSAAGASLTAAAGSTFSGIGSTNTSVTIGGIHSPGDPAGTQSFNGPLNYAATSKLQWRLQANSTAPAASGRVSAQAVTVASGATIDLVLDHPGSTVQFDNAFWTESRSWTVMSASSISGEFSLGEIGLDAGGRPADGYGAFTLEQNASSVQLLFTPHPASSPIDAWRQLHFGADWENPAIAGDEADPDHDGRPNLVEYAMGTDPTTFEPATAPRVTLEGDKLKITFTRNTAATDITISVMAGDDLGSSWTEIARSTNGDPFVAVAEGASVSEHGNDTVITVEATDLYSVSDSDRASRFLRLSVSR